MFRGNLKIWKDKDEWKGTFKAKTPKGPITFNASAKTKSEVGAPLEHISGFYPIGALVGPQTTLLARHIYHRAKNGTLPNAPQALGRISEAAKQGDEQAQDLLYALHKIAEHSMTQKNSTSERPIYVPATLNPTTLLGNLNQKAEQNPNVKSGKAIFNALHSGKPELQKKGFQWYARLVQRSNAGDERADKILQAIQRYGDVRREQERQTVSGLTEIGFSFSTLRKAFKKKPLKLKETFMKKVLPHERKFRKFVTKNKAMVAMIPYVGVGLVAGAEVLNRVDNGDPEAIQNVRATQTLAKAGNPQAQKAIATMQQAQQLRMAIKADTAKAIGTDPPEGWRQVQMYQPLSEKARLQQEYLRIIRQAQAAGLYSLDPGLPDEEDIEDIEDIEDFDQGTPIENLAPFASFYNY